MAPSVPLYSLNVRTSPASRRLARQPPSITHSLVPSRGHTGHPICTTLDVLIVPFRYVAPVWPEVAPRDSPVCVEPVRYGGHCGLKHQNLSICCASTCGPDPHLYLHRRHPARSTKIPPRFRKPDRCWVSRRRLARDPHCSRYGLSLTGSWPKKDTQKAQKDCAFRTGAKEFPYSELPESSLAPEFPWNNGRRSRSLHRWKARVQPVARTLAISKRQMVTCRLDHSAWQTVAPRR